MSDLSINTGSTNNNIINPLVTPKLKFEGKFNYPVITLGSNLWDGGVYSLNGGRSWDPIDTLSYDTQYTLITAQGFSSYLNVSPNNMDICVWSWTESGTGGGCIQHLSHNGGRDWISTYFAGTKFEYTHYNKDTNNIYLGGWVGGSKKSIDAGDNFTTLSMYNNRQIIVFDSSDDENYVYAGTSSTKSIQYSTNQGTSWTEIAVSTTGTQSARIVKCTADGQYVMAYYGAYGILVDLSDDYGHTYTPLTESANGRVEMRRDGSGFFYTALSTGRFYYTTDQGSNWNYISSPYGTAATQNFSQDYENGEIYFWCRTYPTIYKINSTNDGLDLVKTLDNNIWVFSTSQYGRGYIYTSYDGVGAGSIYFSRNLQTWELIRADDDTSIGAYLTIL